MRIRQCFVFFVILIIFSGWPSAQATNEISKANFALWARIQSPTHEPTQPIGTYAAGCLKGAQLLAKDGPGYALMRLSRKRNYGTPWLESYLHDLGTRVQAQSHAVVLIGDVSPARGGPMLSGHNSHQIGLDADLWLRTSRKPPTPKQRESWNAPSFVRHRKRLKKTWGTKQNQLIALAAEDPRVARVFVSPAIKKYLCAKSVKAPWLYKIRPWWGHEEHIHVRLNCPPETPSCVPQAPLDPKDNGCGADLEWWFSAEADTEWAEMQKDLKPREFPVLPKECAELVANPGS